MVRLPMPGGPGEGRSYEFGTPYESMLDDLLRDVKNQDFYKKTRLLDILRRNKQIKRAPERWQDTDTDKVRSYDIVFCYEQRIYDAVIEGTTRDV
jgi:RNA polymerase II subunit A C-terminal domain phosphatase SSU72